MISKLYARGVSESARALGVAPSTVRNWKSRGEVPERYREAVEAWTSGAEVTAPPPLDAIPAGHRVKGVSSLVAPDGSISAQWIKTSCGPESPEALLARLVAEIPATVPRVKAVPGPVSVDADLMAVYPMGDPHIGMMAWKPEAGEDFDLRIAEDLTTRAVRDLVLRGPRAKHALLVNLGDFFHADNAHGHTTGGQHSLDMDGRAPKVLAAGLRIIYAAIDALLEHHERVTVDSRIGNHDGHTALMLSIALAARYENEPRVSIPQTVSHRAYHVFGRNLIGTTHGDRAKAEALGEIMAAERPEDWGRTRHRMWLCGHVHHKTVRELRGVTVETFRTLAARDSWHAAQGYISGRDMTRIVLHREHGEVGREIANVGYLLARAGA